MDHYLPVVFSPPRDGRGLTEPLPIGGQRQPISIGLSTTPSSGNADEMDGEDDVVTRSLVDQQEEGMNGNSSSSSSGSIGCSSQSGGGVDEEYDGDEYKVC